MNIDCSGQGRPTVILESGSGGPSVDWLMVQPQVAKFSRVCSYDRAGYGWSESGPEPRSSLQIAHELKQLLQAASEESPYVLVGHSMGGYDIRVYTGQYPNDVAGMVLVDASHEDQDLRAPQSIRKWSQDYRKHPGWKKLKYFLQLHLGWARMTVDRNAPEFWPKAFREEEDFLMLPTKHQFATIDEDQVFSTLSAAQVRSAGTSAIARSLCLLRRDRTIFLQRSRARTRRRRRIFGSTSYSQSWLVSRPMASRSLSTAATKCQRNIRRSSSRRFMRYGGQLVSTALERIRGPRKCPVSR
jgi:pimeloyl-ACP methyl ester carboxylesterase